LIVHRRRRLLALAAGCALAFLAAFAVSAASDPTSKVLAGDDIEIPAGTTVDHDLYAFGSTVDVAGTINGDLVAAGARITVDGSVTGDVLAAGSEVTINGSVGGDVRAAAGQVTVVGTIGKDLATTTTSLDLGTAGRIGGDLLFAATEVQLDGNIAGGISGAASDYHRTGTVGGPESVGLPVDQSAGERTAALALDALRQFILVMLFGLVFLRFAPTRYRAIAERARRQPFVSAGAGVVVLLGYVAVVIAVVVLAFLFGLAFGVLGFGGFVALDFIGGLLTIVSLTFGLVVFGAFVADAIVGSAIGQLVSLGEGSRSADLIRLAVGAALVVVLTSFPDLGELVKLLVILIGLGAAGTVVWESRRPPAATAAVPVADVWRQPPG
jgi:cytoskeletal protein CcmA (bactofilin family)